MSIFLIHSHNGYARLDFVHYVLGDPPFDVPECQLRGITFAAPLRRIRLTILTKNLSADGQGQCAKTEVCMGEILLMTGNGLFIINGTERVIVSQLQPFAGRVLRARPRQQQPTALGKLLFSARVIPYRGSWLDFEFDPK